MFWARVAKPGQRRKVEGLVSKEFERSNRSPRTHFPRISAEPLASDLQGRKRDGHAVFGPEKSMPAPRDAAGIVPETVPTRRGAPPPTPGSRQ